MARSDIDAALAAVPDHVRQHLTSAGKESLQLLADNLPEAERVLLLASAAPDSFQSKAFNCLLALTDRRLLFVAPAPQVLSWPLPTITRVQMLSGAPEQIETFFVDDSSGGQYQLGADGQWGQRLETQAKRAIAEAILRHG